MLADLDFSMELSIWKFIFVLDSLKDLNFQDSLYKLTDKLRKVKCV